MNKTFLLFCLLIIVSISSTSMAAPPAKDVACDPLGCVDTADIAAFAVISSNIANGAVTDAKVAGPISAAKIEKAANVVVVATSGGDFTSIQAAIDSVTPSASNPYLIRVMPGTYTENISMKSYMHLQGAGKEVTKILSNDGLTVVVTMNQVANAAISGFTIEGGSRGIYTLLNSSIITIEDNLIQGNARGIGNGQCYQNNCRIIVRENIIADNSLVGIENSTADGEITNNIIIRNQYGVIWFYSTIDNEAIIKDNIILNNTLDGLRISDTKAEITGNIIKGNGQDGISTSNSTGYSQRYNYPRITDNTITDNNRHGLYIDINSAEPVIKNNIVTDNGGTQYTDIFSSADVADRPNISFNIYDDIEGSNWTGSFNVKSDGTPW